MTEAFDNPNENQGRIHRCLEEGMPGSLIAKYFPVKKEAKFEMHGPFLKEHPKIKALLDKVIVN